MAWAGAIPRHGRLRDGSPAPCLAEVIPNEHVYGSVQGMGRPDQAAGHIEMATYRFWVLYFKNMTGGTVAS